MHVVGAASIAAPAPVGAAQSMTFDGTKRHGLQLGAGRGRRGAIRRRRATHRHVRGPRTTPLVNLDDVTEEPAPASDVPGEIASKTQPVPSKPPAFARQRMTEADVTDLSPGAKAAVTEKWKALRHDGPNAPVSVKN